MHNLKIEYLIQNRTKECKRDSDILKAAFHKSSVSQMLGARPSRETRYNARGARMTPGNWCTYKAFLDNGLTHSEWGCKTFSLSMGGDFAKNN